MIRSTRLALALLLVASSLGCGGAQSTTCPAGRTMLDGVCVREEVADYVTCVRAQGARLSEDKSRKLSADVGFAGTKAGAASEVQDKLSREYSASDANVLEVIRTCGTLKASSFAGAIDVSGEWESTFDNAGKTQTVAIRLKQNGTSVRGTYWDAGRYEGTLKGLQLEGVWSLGAGSGRFAWTFSEDGKTFEGKWGNGPGDPSLWQRGARR